MAPSVGVRNRLYGALDGSSLVNDRVDRGEGGGEVDEGPRKRRTRVSDGNGDKFHSPPMFLEGRDEGEVLLGLLDMSLVASEVLAKSNFE